MQKVLIPSHNGLFIEMLAIAIARQDDLQIVRPTVPKEQFPMLVERKKIDWVITSYTSDKKKPAWIPHVLQRNPEVGVLVVGADREKTVLFTAHAEKRLSQDMTLESLLGILSKDADIFSSQ